MSVMHKDGPDGPMVAGPNIRRMSRLDPRPSVQYGLANRRMSQISRTSISGASYGMKHGLLPVKVQNTYRLTAGEDEKFSSSTVARMMTGVMESYLDGENYEPKLSANLAQNLSEVIKSRVKDMNLPRYKIVCNVTIGQDGNQGMRVASRCLWDKETDGFAEAIYNKGSMYAVATLYAFYYE